MKGKMHFYILKFLPLFSVLYDGKYVRSTLWNYLIETVLCLHHINSSYNRAEINGPTPTSAAEPLIQVVF